MGYTQRFNRCPVGWKWGWRGGKTGCGQGGCLLAQSSLKKVNPRTLSPDLSFRSSSGAPPLNMNIMTFVLSPCGFIKEEFIEHPVGAGLYLDAGINSTIVGARCLHTLF